MWRILVAVAALAVASPALGQELVYSFPLDTNPGWSMEGGWEFGMPAGFGGEHGGRIGTAGFFGEHGGPDPTAGHTGNSVYGYNLKGDYPNDMASTEWLTTSALDLTGYESVELRFYRWLGVEARCYDAATIQVSKDGTNWNDVWINPDI